MANQKLNEREQEVLRLYGREGFSAREIGAKFKITPQRVLQIIKAARTKMNKRKRPFVLVTVSGGVATIWDTPGVDTDLVDWDNWDGKHPTRDELKYLREVAEQLQDRNDKAEFLREVQELEDRGVAEEEDE